MIKRFFQRPKGAGLSDRVSALDVGSSKISCAIAQVSSQFQSKILGFGHYASEGYGAGIVSDMDSLVHSILQAVHVAEEEAQETIQNIYINVSSALLTSHWLRVETNVSGHEIGFQDIRALIVQALEKFDLPNQEVIHVLPQQYRIDDNAGIKNPQGMFGERLEAHIHLVTAPLSPLRNLVACVEKAHLDVAGLVASSFASGLACLEPDEMDLGTIVLDMGSHTTDIALFSQGNLVWVDVLKMGGIHITKDLAQGLSTSLTHAERLKTLYGSALASSLSDREIILIPQVGDKDSEAGLKMPKAALVQIILPRVEEIFTLVRQKLESLGRKQVGAYRVVLTGGTAELPGILEVARVVLNQTVRLGKPLYSASPYGFTPSPAFSCCVGQLAYVGLSQTQAQGERTSLNRLNIVNSVMNLWKKRKI